MKKIMLIFVALILFSCNKNEIEIPLRIKDNANKGIKVLTESRYSAINTNGEVAKGDLLSKSVRSYNEDGNLLEYLSYGNNGFQKDKQISLLDNLTYKYDEQGYLTEKLSQVEYIMAPSKWEYKNDRYGYEVEMNAYFKDGSKISSLKTTYKYDDNGNATEYMAVNTDVHFYTIVTYEYDANGNKIVITNYDASGIASAISNYKYLNLDNAGNWCRQDCYLNGVTEWIKEREIEYY